MTTWLLLAAGEDREHGGNSGYQDDPSRTYVWDSTVYHHRKIAVGDVIAVWDKRVLLGMSIIDAIDSRPETKDLSKCPECGKAAIKARATLTPRFKCYACEALFEKPVVNTVPVTTFASSHARAWVDMDGAVDGATLRAACLQPKSQHSIRQMNHGALWQHVEKLAGAAPLRLLEDAAKRAAPQGHRRTMVRTRLGQGAFRRSLIQRFGSLCALTGPAPLHALEAAHLYSYAETGEHRAGGGLLLRKDVHRLFDLGLLALQPDRRSVSVHPDLHAFPVYRALEGTTPFVDLSTAELTWLRRHWYQWRGGE
ncbi:HNH endonuclease [uncultured Pseudokineococcus sp.]|uniref:HNH endonuclease n=1 Tax=uncultured Pseudokineococcus sp. TaxID=1642928 RepID=UPI00260940BB|nr:HNH endonuclease [uncultured Pseudokineococcus sp.]